jgi:hypothetical protein
MPHSHHLNRLQAGLGLATNAEVAANQSLFPDSNTPAKPIVARNAEQLPAPVEPYSSIMEVACHDCGGDGRDHGCADDYYACEACGGSGTEAVLRNWLGEAFQLSEGQLDTDLRIEHVRAMRHYATQVLNAYATPLAREVA